MADATQGQLAVPDTSGKWLPANEESLQRWFAKATPVEQQLARICRLGDDSQFKDFLSADGGVDATLAFKDVEGNTMLHVASFFGHEGLVKELIVQCEVDIRDGMQRTPLHVAAREGYAGVALALLGADADAAAVDSSGETAVHKAVVSGHLELLQVLGENERTDLALVDQHRMSPLLSATKLGQPQMVEFLLSKDPSLASARSEADWTALHLAAHGTSSKVSSLKPDKFLASLKLLVAAGAPVDATDEDKRTPLHRAASNGSLAAASTLLEARADVAAADICRWMPLHHACQGGHLAMAKLLLQAKAPPQVENPPSLTPLAVAVTENNAKMAELLVTHNADPNLRGKGLASPMQIARQDKEKYSDILSLFELGFIGHK